MLSQLRAQSPSWKTFSRIWIPWQRLPLLRSLWLLVKSHSMPQTRLWALFRTTSPIPVWQLVNTRSSKLKIVDTLKLSAYLVCLLLLLITRQLQTSQSQRRQIWIWSEFTQSRSKQRFVFPTITQKAHALLGLYSIHLKSEWSPARFPASLAYQLLPTCFTPLDSLI